MDDLKKDPYLSELDALDPVEEPSHTGDYVDEELLAHAAEESTKDESTNIDIKLPPLSVDQQASSETLEDLMGDAQNLLADSHELSQGPAPVRELLNLSPDISLPLVAVIGRKNVTLKDLLELRMGQVIELGRAPTEPIDLMTDGKLIAKGELVEIDGQLGVRILKLLK